MPGDHGKVVEFLRDYYLQHGRTSAQPRTFYWLADWTGFRPDRLWLLHPDWAGPRYAMPGAANGTADADSPRPDH